MSSSTTSGSVRDHSRSQRGRCYFERQSMCHSGGLLGFSGVVSYASVGLKINPSAGTVALWSDAASPSVCAEARLIIQGDKVVDIIKLWRTGTVSSERTYACKSTERPNETMRRNVRCGFVSHHIVLWIKKMFVTVDGDHVCQAMLNCLCTTESVGGY